jgi:hypothetical protein
MKGLTVAAAAAVPAPPSASSPELVAVDEVVLVLELELLLLPQAANSRAEHKPITSKTAALPKNRRDICLSSIVNVCIHI